MNNAQLEGFRMIAQAMGCPTSEEAIRRTDDGWEAWRGDKLVGVTQRYAGALELLSATRGGK